VVTSARLDSRAPHGFGAALRAVSLQLAAADAMANDTILQACEDSEHSDATP
jgi:hypothetical protein